MNKKTELSKVNDNLIKGRLYASIANFTAAILFFVAYVYYKDILFMVAALILIVAGIGIIVVFSVFKQKLNKVNDQSDFNNKQKN